ncbi:MAG: Modification methylase HhaI [SAR116 cluster bacterium]|nr:MAG: Modification methylase HhaI [SAR116 cluster bacterium]
MNQSLRFIDLFAGIGGFHLALHDLGGECVFVYEIDKYARQTYEKNFFPMSPELFASESFALDVTQVDLGGVPDYNILCAGFPCQPFSQAGYKRGFHEEKDNRGNMFFEILKFVDAHKPDVLFLENVRHLKNHDDGRTFKTIEEEITKRGYSFNAKIVKASDFNLPQHRPRLYMVCFNCRIKNRDEFKFPEPVPLNYFMTDVFGEPRNKSIGYTLRVGGKSSGLNDRRNWDTYMVNGKIRKITSVEGKIMNGFPTDFQFPVSETQAMKQLGNSVAENAVRATAEKIIKTLQAR